VRKPRLAWLEAASVYLVTFLVSLVEASLRASTPDVNAVVAQNYIEHGSNTYETGSGDLSREKREGEGAAEATMKLEESDREHKLYGAIYHDDKNETKWYEDAQKEATGAYTPPPYYVKEGPMPTISDSLFSLIILIYVSVIFVFMFFSFCWKEPEPPPPDPAHKNIPMITSILEEMEKQELENKKAAEAAAVAAALSDDSGSLSCNGATVTEMVEMKNIENSNKSNTAVNAGDSGQGGKTESDTIIVNVITEKAKNAAAAGSGSKATKGDSNVKEEQV